MRDAVDATKRVLTKEKLDKQLSRQAGTATPFMKVGDISHSGKKVSFIEQDPIREQLESLTSMMCNMSMQKEENTKPFKPQVHQKRGRGQNRQNFGNRDRSRWFNSDKDKCLDPTIGDGHEIDNMGTIIEEEIIDIKIIVEMKAETEERQNFRGSFSNDNRSRSPTPRGIGNRRYNSPNANLGTRSRSDSRVTTNRDSIRCFRCREYDHFANECPNLGTDDLDGYESDRAALQLMTTGTEAHDNFDTSRLTEEADYLNLWRVKNGATSFLPKTKQGGQVRFNDKITYLPDREKICLTEDQARHIYKKAEMDRPVNTETMTQEIEDDKMTRNRLKEEEDENEPKSLPNGSFK